MCRNWIFGDSCNTSSRPITYSVTEKKNEKHIDPNVLKILQINNGYACSTLSLEQIRCLGLEEDLKLCMAKC